MRALILYTFNLFYFINVRINILYPLEVKSVILVGANLHTYIDLTSIAKFQDGFPKTNAQIKQQS
jgi:hypothetical protein